MVVRSDSYATGQSARDRCGRGNSGIPCRQPLCPQDAFVRERSAVEEGLLASQRLDSPAAGISGRRVRCGYPGLCCDEQSSAFGGQNSAGCWHVLVGCRCGSPMVESVSEAKKQRQIACGTHQRRVRQDQQQSQRDKGKASAVVKFVVVYEVLV